MTVTDITRYAAKWAPSKLVTFARKLGADFDAFCGLDEPAMQLLPQLPDGYVYTDDSVAILKCRNVEPHIDSDVGKVPEGYVFCGAAFGLLAGASQIVLQAGNSSKRMKPGDWVMFDDSLLHGVYSEKLWYGIAVQIARKK